MRKIFYVIDFPTPEMNGYTMESTIAEKFQAMVRHGLLNSRMKAFFDIWFLSSRYDFKGEILTEAIEKTFEIRKTILTSNPTIFNPSFIKDDTKQTQWAGFTDKAKLADAPISFEDVANDIKIFLQPIATSINHRQKFQLFWAAPGPWSA